MTETTVLYVLSTLAQTCAALAAFVGAVGLFRLQALGNQRIEAEREFRILTGRIVHRDIMLTPINEFLVVLDRVSQEREANDPNVQAAQKARDRWTAFVPRIKSSRSVLVIFEGWNLLVILVSLVGFNHVSWLASWPGASWALWLVALGTVGVTGWCVYGWTRE